MTDASIRPSKRGSDLSRVTFLDVFVALRGQVSSDAMKGIADEDAAQILLWRYESLSRPCEQCDSATGFHCMERGEDGLVQSRHPHASRYDFSQRIAEANEVAQAITGNAMSRKQRLRYFTALRGRRSEPRPDAASYWEGYATKPKPSVCDSLPYVTAGMLSTNQLRHFYDQLCKELEKTDSIQTSVLDRISESI